MKTKNLASLIDAWVADYSAEEFAEEFGLELTFGEMVEMLYGAGEVPNEVIESFLEA